MAVTLIPNQTEAYSVNGVPPGTGAVEFNSSLMWNSVNDYISQKGTDSAKTEVAESFIKGLNLDIDLSGLDARIAKDAIAKEGAEASKSLASSGMYQASGDLSQNDIALQAGIEKAANPNLGQGHNV